MSTVRIIEDWSREVNIPKGCEDWEIYNAPRPFPATVTWQGEFIRGVFYGAINPEDEFAVENRIRTQQLDASRLVFVSREEVETWGHAYCVEHDVNYGDFDFDDIAKAYLRHAIDRHTEEKGL